MPHLLLSMLLVVLIPCFARAATGSVPDTTPPVGDEVPHFHGDLSITVQPVDAELRIDEQVQRVPFPAVWHLEPGLHRVDVFKTGYRLKSFNILVPLDAWVKRQVALVPDAGPDAPPTSPGQVFRDCEDMIAGKHVCPEMVVIAPGTFTMGAQEDEITSHERDAARFMGRRFEDGPPHVVTISQPFAAGRFEVTFDEWDACEADGGCRQKLFYNFWARGRQPVIMVSWDDTQRYVTWLSHKTGENYRLLSEAEWEYAARAGTTTPYYTGNFITDKQANIDGYCKYFCNADVVMHTGRVTADDRERGLPSDQWRGGPIAVGSFAPNEFGLYDMAGNVAEWVQDCWQRYDNGKRLPVEEFRENCEYRVTRGGDFYSVESEVRSSARLALFHDSRWVSLGFRIGRTLKP